ncbi:jg23649, partial [Pararge aegeria aegeria]
MSNIPFSNSHSVLTGGIFEIEWLPWFRLLIYVGFPPHLGPGTELKECCGRVFVDSVPEFCPPLDKVVDFSQLDVILISNYTCMLALPFVTEDTGFKGQVYATEPTLQ